MIKLSDSIRDNKGAKPRAALRERIIKAGTFAIRFLSDNCARDDKICIACGRESKLIGDTGLCADCYPLDLNVGSLCRKCGKMLTNPNDKYCAICLAHPMAFDTAYSVFRYENEIEKIIRRCKFGDKMYYCRFMSEHLRQYILDKSIEFDVLTYVPDYGDAVSCAYYLSSSLAHKLNVPLVPLVTKTRDTPQQHKLNRRERLTNLKDAFRYAADKKTVRNKRVLIIDDVLTTGSTLSEVALAIKKGKPRSVTALTFASAIEPEHRYTTRAFLTNQASPQTTNATPAYSANTAAASAYSTNNAKLSLTE